MSININVTMLLLSFQIAEKHKDWILKKNGSTTVPANSANCGKWFYGLVSCKDQ
jgi:hypothetical protein